MITYQVKISVDARIEEDFIQWMKTQHVPDVIATGLIKSFQILQPQIGEEHCYYFHYHFTNQQDFDQYTKVFGPKLKADVLERYPNQFEAQRQVFDWI